MCWNHSISLPGSGIDIKIPPSQYPRIPTIKLRRSVDSLIFVMGIPTSRDHSGSISNHKTKWRHFDVSLLKWTLYLFRSGHCVSFEVGTASDFGHKYTDSWTSNLSWNEIIDMFMFYSGHWFCCVLFSFSFWGPFEPLPIPQNNNM